MTGLYYIASHCTKEEAKPFQDFIYFDLLPNIRKNIKEEYQNLIKYKDDKINTLIKQNNEILSNHKNLENQNKEILSTNKNLEIQNQQLIELAKKQNIKLDETNQILTETKEQLEETNEDLEETNYKLDNLTQIVTRDILPNRNLPLKDNNLNHCFVLYQIENEFKFIRGQKKYINQIYSSNQKLKVLFETDYPNPIDFKNKLKELSNSKKKLLEEKIKILIQQKYLNLSSEDKKKKSQALYLKNKFFTINNTNLILNKTDINEIIEFCNHILDEQKKIDEATHETIDI